MDEDKRDAAKDVPTFSGTAKEGHFACEIALPAVLPSSWAKPAAYVIAAVNRKFGENPAFLHAVDLRSSVLFIASEQSVCEQMRLLATSVTKQTEPPSYNFRILAEGIGSLNNVQLRTLLSVLGGEILKLEFKGQFACEHYGHTALVELKQPRNWRLLQHKIPFRSNNRDFVATLRILNPPRNVPHSRRIQAQHAAGGPAAEGKLHAAKDPTRVPPGACRDFARGACSRHICRFNHASSCTADSTLASGSSASSTSGSSASEVVAPSGSSSPLLISAAVGVTLAAEEAVDEVPVVSDLELSFVDG